MRRREVGPVLLVGLLLTTMGWMGVEVIKGRRQGKVSTRLEPLRFRAGGRESRHAWQATRWSLLVAYAPECPFCAAQLAEMDRRVGDLGVMSIFLLTDTEPPAGPEGRLHQLRKAPFVTFGVIEPGSMRTVFGQSPRPTTLLVDGRGVIRGRWVGEVSVETLLATARTHFSREAR